jgi:hypothetical protein
MNGFLTNDDKFEQISKEDEDRKKLAKKIEVEMNHDEEE